MHAINLGLCYGTNGAALTLRWKFSQLYFVNFFYFCDIVDNASIHPFHLLASDVLSPDRMLLIENSYFDSYNENKIQNSLDIAYERFRSFCKNHKITCSQPPFTVRLVTSFVLGWNVSH